MSQGESYIFYSFARADDDRRDRWEDTGIPEIFYHDDESARAALRDLRKSVENESEDTLPPMKLEKIETLPVSRDSVFALLNNGVGAFVKNYEIIGIID